MFCAGGGGDTKLTITIPRVRTLEHGECVNDATLIHVLSRKEKLQ